jgi:cation:H+ antiporter
VVDLDVNRVVFSSRPLNTTRAWVVLATSIVIVGAACYGLADFVVMGADALQVPLYFTTVIVAAAATSVPDTVLSIKDARKGDYDDAVSNALGSNIFDITVALGLPLLLYGLMYGDVELHAAGSSSADVQALRIALVFVTLAVLAMMLLGKGMGRIKALLLVGLYLVWTAFVVGRAMNLPFLDFVG